MRNGKVGDVEENGGDADTWATHRVNPARA
jgi:hypothetical protein